MPGVRVVFDVAIDEGSWPGRSAGPASFGELWEGPMGFLAFLETGLGLGAKFVGAIERAQTLGKLLESRDGFWKASFATDAMATSERLLADRDLLVMHGWQGEELSQRLTALWQATMGAPVGMADRLRSVLAALATQQVDVESVRLYQARESLAPLWGLVLAALQRQGVAIDEQRLPAVEQSGDLLAAQSPGFAPSGDGGVTLLRAHGQLAAAEEIAASLAQMTSLDGVVVIAGDSMLDEALARHGLPRLGLGTSPPASHALVQLVLETAFAPMDPAHLHALLCLDPGPVPRSVSNRLNRAISSVPGRQGPDWDRELGEALTRIDDDDKRAKVAARIQALVMPAASRDEALPLDALKARLQCLSTWARGRLEHDAALAGVVGHCQRLLDLALETELVAFTQSELLDLCADTAGGGSRNAAQAGISAVAEPAAILGPARIVIWWDFTRMSAARPRRVRLTNAERAAMRDANMRPPDSSAEMGYAAACWQRPLRLASEALILVSPEVDASGDASHPHPLWDELCSAMSESHLATTLIQRELALSAPALRQRLSRAPLPEASDEVQISARLPMREVDSPSSLKGLLGCSLKWALNYHASLYSGISGGPGEPSPLLYGTIAHYLLGEVFAGGALGEDEAAAAATALVDSDLIRMCEALGLPRYQDNLAVVRRAIIESARQLGLIMRESGAEVRGVEIDVERDFGDMRVKGRADMILRNPDVVIDLKWGKSTNYKSLKSGTSLQLAAYAHAAEEDGRLPSVAYFILRDQILLAEPDSPLGDAQTPGTIKVAETWQATLTSLGKRRQNISEGRLHAPGALGEDIESAMVGDDIVMNPECGYCDYGPLCGRGAGR